MLEFFHVSEKKRYVTYERVSHYYIWHLIVVDAGQHDGSLVELKQRHSHGPEVDSLVVFQPQHNLGSSIVTAHQIRRRIIVGIALAERRTGTRVERHKACWQRGRGASS